MKNLPVPIGERFGNLTVVDGGTLGKWKVLCVCGLEQYIHSEALRQGNYISCGCLKSDTVRPTVARHGMTGTPTYITWKSMRKRVLNPSEKDAAHYIGITCCERWEEFENFLEDMGEKPVGMSLDRIKGTEGYSKENCRWATPQQQSANRKSSVMVEYAGRVQCVAEWAREIGISRKGLVKRLAFGWSLEEALTKPCRPQKKRKE